jgi:hypothetical protein
VYSTYKLFDCSRRYIQVLCIYNNNLYPKVYSSRQDHWCYISAGTSWGYVGVVSHVNVELEKAWNPGPNSKFSTTTHYLQLASTTRRSRHHATMTTMIVATTSTCLAFCSCSRYKLLKPYLPSFLLLGWLVMGMRQVRFFPSFPPYCIGT